MNNEKTQQTENILNSLDGTKRASVPPFFYTRLKARMERELVPVAKRPRVLRPAYAFVALVIVLLVNAAVILTKDTTPATAVNSDNETLQSIASEYNINDVNSLYDLNQEK